MKRRHFLQFAGSTLAAMGMSQLDFLTQAQSYSQAMAQGTSRKLALLIGVNEYPGFIPDLRGCVTDVDLQYELLTHRFGFNPADIIKISDNESLKPNRETVLNVFQEHLVKQAKPGDVVVFHYSGHGIQVVDPDPIYEGNNLNGAMILNDPLPPLGSEDENTLSVIMGRTLFLLLSQLQTNNVTTILDSCHSGGGLRGSSVVRAVPNNTRAAGDPWEAIPAEFELQQQFLEEMGLSAEAFLAARKAGVAKGLGIGSAQFSELALDAPFDGFLSGAFSYLLTRYLWQTPGAASAQTVRTNIRRSTQAAAAAKHHSQVPSFQAAPDMDASAPILFTAPTTGPAEAVVMSVNGDQVEFWLGGLSSQALALEEANTQFTVLDSDRNSIAEVQQTSRNGLIGFGKLVSSETAISAGMLMRETVVGLPANPQLKIGVHESLGAQVGEAISALSNAMSSGGRSQIVASAVDQQTTFDYILGRVTPESVDQITVASEEEIPPIGTVSLFTPAMEPTGATHGRVDETATSAVNRLKPQLKLLLANKVIKALTAAPSGLSVSGEIFSTDGVSVPIAGSDINSRSLSQGATSTRPFKAGQDIKIRVANETQRDALYLSCLAIDQSGNMQVIYPAQWDAPEDAALIAPQSELVVPRPEDGVKFAVNGSGFLEIVTITSVGSLRNALRGLQEIASSRGVTRGYIGLDGDESIGILNDLLGDFDRISRSASLRVVDADESDTVVDSGAIALTSTVIEVSES